MANAFTFHGTDVSTLGVVVASSTTQGMADVTFNWSQRGLSQGGVPFGGQRQPKRWTDNCYIVGTSESNLRTRADTLRTLLDPRHGDRLYVSDAETNLSANLKRGQYCRVNGPINFTFAGYWAYQFELNWINVRGVEVSTAESTDTGNTTSFNVVVGGNTYAYPTYTVTGTTYTLTNTTTGEALTMTGGAATQTINTWNRTITATVLGSTVNILGYMVPGGVFPRLQGGATNAFTVTGGATVDVAWRDAWL